LCLQVKLSSALKSLISSSTCSYGKVKLVLKENKFWVETADTKVSNLQPARVLHSKPEEYTVQHYAYYRVPAQSSMTAVLQQQTDVLLARHLHDVLNNTPCLVLRPFNSFSPTLSCYSNQHLGMNSCTPVLCVLCLPLVPGA